MNDVAEDYSLGVQFATGGENITPLELTGEEALSQPFLFRLIARYQSDQSLPFDQYLGKAAVVSLSDHRGPVRYFHGVVTRIEERERDETSIEYEMQLRPKLWLLQKRVRSQIFQGKTVLQLVGDLLRGTDFRIGNFEDSATHEYCVQYRESDFDFISRLLEEEGLHYYFVHTADQHVMVIADGNDTHFPGGDVEAAYHPFAGAAQPGRSIRRFRVAQDVIASGVALCEYHFQLADCQIQSTRSVKPRVKVGSRTATLTHLGSDCTIEEMAGGCSHRVDAIGPNREDQSDRLTSLYSLGERYAQLAAEREAATSFDISGEGEQGELAAGRHLKLTQHADWAGDYLVTRIQHDIRVRDPHAKSNDAESARRYTNRFACIPAELAYRPPLVTACPRVHGLQTATVVGLSSEEIYTDHYGRVRVRFHWDTKEEGQSCWVRVSQSWTGPGFGSNFLPRAGAEVIVSFQDGDLDQPVIIGNLHNSSEPPSLSLPSDRTMSGFTTRSKGGSPQSNSKLLFDDASGKERMIMHSERDMAVGVENNYTEYVAGGRTTYIGYGSGPNGGNNYYASANSGSGSGGESDISDGMTANPVDAAEDSSDKAKDVFNKIFVDGNSFSLTRGTIEYIVVGAEVDYFGGYIFASAPLSVNVVAGVQLSLTAALDLAFSATANWSVSKSHTFFASSDVDVEATGMITQVSFGATTMLAGAAFMIDSGLALTLSSGVSVVIDATTSVTITSASIVLTGDVSVIGSLSVDGILSVSGAVSVSGGLDVTGYAALTGEVDMEGAVNITGALLVNGMPPMYA